MSHKETICPHCGYAMKRSHGVKCPECGGSRHDKKREYIMQPINDPLETRRRLRDQGNRPRMR